MKQSDTRATSYRIAGLVFFALIVLIMIIHLIVPDKELSVVENRTLQRAPELSLQGLGDGTFMDEFESYEADQFPARNLLRNIRVSVDRIGGNRLSNGIYLGKGSQLLELPAVPSPERLDRNSTAIRNYVKRHRESGMNTYMMLVPEAAEILGKKLPALADVTDLTPYYDKLSRLLGGDLTWIDVRETLTEHSDEKLYYLTDHHWTTQAAYYAFLTAAPFMEADTGASYKTYAVSNSFNGVLSGTSGFSRNVREEIDIMVPEEEPAILATYVSEQKKVPTLYDSSKLEEKDQYQVFLGGNSPVIDIKTSTMNKKHLLVIKDSYANCFIPFLSTSYAEIVVVDPRYYAGSIEDVVSQYHITDTLFLYSGNIFFQDNVLAGVLEE